MIAAERERQEPAVDDLRPGAHERVPRRTDAEDRRWGGLITGVIAVIPNVPRLDTVKVAPVILRRGPSRAHPLDKLSALGSRPPRRPGT